MGNSTYTDIIIPLPGETFATHIKGLRKLFDMGVDNIQNHNMRMLPGSEMNSSIVRKKFLEDNKIHFSEEKNFSPTEDYDFWLRIAKNEAKFKFLDTVLGEHLFHLKSWGSKNRIIFRESERSYAKYHVFNIQNFTSNKKNLWSYVESRLIIDDIIDLLRSKNYFKAFGAAIKLIYQYPIKSFKINVFFIKSKKKIIILNLIVLL